MKVEPVAPDAPTTEFIPASDDTPKVTMEDLKNRLDACVRNGQVSNEAAGAAFKDFSESENVFDFLAFVVNLEQRPKTAPQAVVEQTEKSQIPVSNDDMMPRKVVRSPSQAEPEDKRDWERLKAEYDGATIVPPPMAEVSATEIFTPLDLPSQCILYDVGGVKGRKLGLQHMRKLHSLLTIQSPSILIEALSTTIDFDIQKLTQGDLTYLLYWLRSSSLPKSPMQVKWVSRYGTTETMVVNLSKLKEIRVPLTEESRERLEYFNGLGFDMPRVYDILAISRYDAVENPEVEQWVYEQSQYFKPLPGETVGQRLKRIEKLMDNDISLLEELKEFKTMFAHGVNETVDVQVDLNKFDPKEAIRNLTAAADRNDAALFRFGFDETIFEINQDYRKEIVEIEEKLEKGESVIPRVEKVDVNIDALSFFSAIQA